MALYANDRDIRRFYRRLRTLGEIALSPSFWYISAHMHNFCILETIVVSPCTLETMW
jgi:hypothetical protein